MIPIPAAALIALGLVLVLLRSFLRRRNLQHIRGPERLKSILGHDYAMALQDDIGDLEFEWFNEYGATWRTQGAFGMDHIMTADPQALQHIYHKSGYKYMKKPSQNHIYYLLAGPGIVWTQGEAHQRHRKIMNPAFSASHLKSFLPLFQRITSKLVKKWKVELSTAPELFTIINNWLSRATLDVIGQAAFDYDYGCLGDSEESILAKEYHGILKDAEFRLSKPVMLFRATWDYLPESILKLFRYIPIHPFNRMLSLKRIYTTYARQILREKRPQVDAEKRIDTEDIMSILIKASASSDAKTRLEDEELMAQMFTLTLAGHETTASTISSILYELAKNPDYQARVREEIKAARAQLLARGGVDFTTEDLDNMPVCLNAIKETLRFHPMTSYLYRVATQDDVLPLAYPITSTTGETITEIPIIKGQVVLTSTFVYNRLPQVWGEDSHVWNPDRFNRIDTGKQTKVGVFANLMTFSAGVRGCIGWRFSILETQAMLAELLETFQFQLPVGAENIKDPKKSEVQWAPTGSAMVALIRGKPELGPAIRLRISLVQSK
ncbi:PAH-inducible cytochrome P450 monooxygenase PC-PAH 4 [Trametes gibbosa]|nr:PAH-inducible cytochrome P450 monooxygenase PC-PAH 4 [Trametes gibbosa]